MELNFWRGANGWRERQWKWKRYTGRRKTVWEKDSFWNALHCSAEKSPVSRGDLAAHSLVKRVKNAGKNVKELLRFEFNLLVHFATEWLLQVWLWVFDWNFSKSKLLDKPEKVFWKNKIGFGKPKFFHRRLKVFGSGHLLQKYSNCHLHVWPKFDQQCS